jgi:leucyl/phenylalanyl-tRNA--protein transferase
MFSRERDASKVALVSLVEVLASQPFSLLDVQWVTDHLASLGAVSIGRSEYLRRLAAAIEAPRVPGPWRDNL